MPCDEEEQSEPVPAENLMVTLLPERIFEMQVSSRPKGRTPLEPPKPNLPAVAQAEETAANGLQRRLADYLELRAQLAGKLKPLSPTPSASDSSSFVTVGSICWMPPAMVIP